MYEEGRLVRRGADGSWTETWSYDEEGRLTSAVKPDRGEAWRYDAEGNVERRTHVIDDVVEGERTDWWRWDGARLVSHSWNGGSSGGGTDWVVHDGDLPVEGHTWGGNSGGRTWEWAEGYSWDDAGRPLTRSSGAYEYTSGWEWDGDQLVAYGYFDPEGAFVRKMTWAWDEAGRLLAEDRGTQVTTWDWDGDRVIRMAVEVEGALTVEWRFSGACGRVAPTPTADGWPAEGPPWPEPPPPPGAWQPAW